MEIKMIFQQRIVYALNTAVLFFTCAEYLQPVTLGKSGGVNISENFDFKPPKLYAI